MTGFMPTAVIAYATEERIVR